MRAVGSGVFALVATLACEAPRPTPSSGGARSPARVVPGIEHTADRAAATAGLDCGAAAPRGAARDEVVGKVAVWNRPFDTSTGPMTFDAAAGLLVALSYRAPGVSLDPETGATCASLADARSQSVTLRVDVTSPRVTVAGDAWIVPSGTALAAIDVQSGATRWTQAVPELTSREESVLREEVEVVSAERSVVASLQVPHAGEGGYHSDRLTVAFELATGAERWRHRLENVAFVLRPGQRTSLVSDGAVPLLLLKDRLVGLDPGTGREAFTVTWQEQDDPKLFAGGHRALLAFANGKLRFWEVDSGKPAGATELATKTVTSATLCDDAAFIATEDANGRPVLWALERDLRVRWKYDATYSVRGVRVAADARTLYVLEGDGRLWVLDASSGARLAGLALGEVSDFAVAKSPSGAVHVVVPIAGLSAFELEPNEKPAPLAPFLRWELNPETLTEGGFSDFCTARAVEWVLGDGKVAWRRQLPPHLQRDGRESCRQYRRRPRLQPFRRMLETDAALILASRSGVLALRRKDGSVLLDAAATSASTFLFDEGTFSLEGGSPCTGRSPSVFAFCDPHYLLFFNGVEGVLIDTRTWRIEARGTVSDVKSVDGRPSLREARVRLGTRTLTLRGVTYMR